MSSLKPGMFPKCGRFGQDQVSRTIWHGPNIHMDIWDKTKCLLIVHLMHLWNLIRQSIYVVTLKSMKMNCISYWSLMVSNFNDVGITQKKLVPFIEELNTHLTQQSENLEDRGGEETTEGPFLPSAKMISQQINDNMCELQQHPLP